MKQSLKLLLLLFVAGNIQAQLPAGLSDSTYYILPNGAQNKYYYQRDVAVFRYNGGAAFADTLPAFVTSIEWLKNDWHGYNRITFDSAAPHAQCMAYWYYLHGYPGFEYGFLPVTKDKDSCAAAKKWCMLSDLINIRFASTPISNTDLVAFTTRNNLKLYHRPDAALPNADSWIWAFELLDKARFTPLDACAQIFNNENGFVTLCEPDIHEAHSDGGPAFSCSSLPTEFAAFAATPFPNMLWHINNNGGVVNPGLGSGYAGADAKICDCWGAGYDGTGVRVAVIDNGDTYDYSHPNLQGQLLPGYNFNTNQSFTSSINGGTSVHGMEVASVIAGIPNGGQISGANVSGVGVAYGAKILPYICDLGLIQVPMVIQKAVTDGASVVNMSWSTVSSTFTLNSIYASIEQAVQTGRNGLGLIFVGSVGNDNGDKISYPAIMEDVIGVGATDPNDFRGSINAPDGTWDWTNIIGFGSNYHDLNVSAPTLHYDVVAPGTCIHTDFTDYSVNPPTQTSFVTSGTSLSTPVVSGIAAMLLQQNPAYTYNDVINTIAQNTDKPNLLWFPSITYPYDYNQYSFLPGYDKEMFFGRVNCAKAIANPVVGIKENNKTNDPIKLAYVSEKEVLLLLDTKTNTSGAVLTITDLSGRLVSSQKIEANSAQHTFNTENLENGVYLFKVISITNNWSATFKYIK